MSIPAPPRSPSIPPPDALQDRGAVTAIRPPPLALFAALGVGVALLAIGIVVLVARGIGAARPITSETVASATSLTSAPSPIAPPSVTASPPVVDLDSLPVASSRAPNPVKGMGFITITASPGACAVAIDGSARGWTPLSVVKLPIGPHEVQCFPANGRPRSMTVAVSEGVVSKFRFDLDETP